MENKWNLLKIYALICTVQRNYEFNTHKLHCQSKN